jgi:hypothetical protein
VDTFAGGVGNDTFNATDSTITGLDNIDGGAGADTMTISDVAGAATVSFLTVKNVETLNLVSTGGLKASTDVSGWTGLTAANVTLQGVAADQSLKVTNGSALNLTAKVTTASKIDLTGGNTVAATVTNSTNNSAKTLTVNGDASTTTVTLTQSGTAADAAGVAINDLNNGVAGKANTITTVTIDGLTGGTATVKSDALATLNLANSAKDVTVTNGTSKHTLAVNLNKVTGGTIKDAAATTLNVTTNGTSAGLTLDAGEATTINFAGAAALTTLLSAGKLTTATIAGAGGLTADLSIATVTSVNAANSTAANTITLDATKATFVGGTGADTLILSAAPSKSVDGGAGSDVLSLAAVADLSSLTTKALANATNFEVLGLTGAYGTGGDVGKSTLDLSAVTGFTGVQIDSKTAANDLVLSNASASTALTLVQVTGTKTTVSLKTDGASDALSLTLGNAKSAALDFSGKAITAGGQDTVTVVANADTSAAAVQHKLVLALDSAATLNVSGAAGVDFTGSTFTKLATVNSTSAGNLKIALSVDVATSVTTGAGDDTIATASNPGTLAATINAGDGANSVTTYAGNDVITTGKGDDTINAGAGNNTVTAGDGKNGVTVANGNNTITTGAGADTIAVGNGNNTITAGAGDDTVTVGTGASTVTLGAGADTLKFAGVNTSSSTFTTVTDLAKGDIITTNAGFGNTTGTLGAALTSGVNDYQTYLAAAAAKGAGVVSWFQWGGDTFLVQDNTAGVGVPNANSFNDGADLIVKITGLVDLSTSTLTQGAANLTIA